MTSETEGSYQRWYDRDPALSRALDMLRQASDIYQAQVALNIIKIIVEHQTEEASKTEVEELAGRISAGESIERQILRRRWYDVNETLRSAMQLLRDCPEDLQKTIIPTITRMIEETLNQHY
jgi:hypothetical protein